MNRNQATFPSLKRRGGCGINQISRSDRIAADGVVSSAKALRPDDFAGLTTPSARTKVAARYFLTAHPPLYFKERNILARQFIHTFYDRALAVRFDFTNFSELFPSSVRVRPDAFAYPVLQARPCEKAHEGRAMMGRRVKVASLGLMIAALCFCISALAFGQSVNATVGGTVVDASGALIPGVTVTATNTGTGIMNTVVTNESGAYNFAALQ